MGSFCHGVDGHILREAPFLIQPALPYPSTVCDDNKVLRQKHDWACEYNWIKLFKFASPQMRYMGRRGWRRNRYVCEEVKVEEMYSTDITIIITFHVRFICRALLITILWSLTKCARGLGFRRGAAASAAGAERVESWDIINAIDADIRVGMWGCWL